jgi:DmsE family decaheme c-type cytochrome
MLRPVKATAINEQCAKCHLSEWAKFQKPYHHRLPEGAMSCVDCHNPHGSFLPRMIQTVAANEPGCFRCHAEKRGPFTFEHAPVKFEGCTSCHEPHGSANPRMLTRAEVRFLCLECHSNIAVASTSGGIPPAFHNLNSARFRNCTICHSKIHGSYVDASLER